MSFTSVIVEVPAPIESAVVEVPSPPEVTLVQGGPQGPQGIPGPPGPSGATSVPAPFVYVQAVPAAMWSVSHDLGRYPASVVVYDSSGNVVETGVVVLDLNTVEITMASAMAGTVVVQ